MVQDCVGGHEGAGREEVGGAFGGLVSDGVVAVAVEAAPVGVVDLDPSLLAEYVGVYERSGAQFTVTLEDEQIFVQITGQQALPAFASSKDEFFLRVVDAQISFGRDSGGAVNQLVLHQNGRSVPWERVR